MPLREEIERQGNWLFKWRSYLPLLAAPLLIIALSRARVLGDKAGGYWTAFAIFISFLGLGLRGLTVGYVPRGTSGRNTKSQAANNLNTTGMYSILRHPLYVGNFIIMVGITLFIQVWWLALVVWVGFWLYYERIIFSEEELLRRKFGATFIEWAQKTPLIFPKFANWKKPELPFSIKTVVRREFSTFFSIIASYFFLEISANLLAKRKFQVQMPWVYFFIIGLLIYFTCLILKKKTKLLDAPGR
jgi:protein-S-isoprenylcysteine O-methyltransferase Ste14